MTEEFGQLPAIARDLYLRALLEDGLPAHLGDAPGTLNAATRQAMQQLLELGLLRPGVDRPGLLVPVDPSIAAERHTQRAAQRVAEVVGLGDRWASLTSAYRSSRGWTDEDAPVRYYRGKEAIGQVLDMHLSGAKERVRTMQPGGQRPAGKLQDATHQELKMLGRGVARHILYQTPARHHHHTGDFVRKVVDAGGQVRVRPTLPSRLFLIDDLAVYPLLGDNAVAVVNTDPSTVALLNGVFDDCWQAAEPYFMDAPSARHELTSQQRDLLRLLADGRTSKSIATHMGTSERTVNRMIEQAKELFDVRTPLQLGFRMGQEYPGGLPAEW